MNEVLLMFFCLSLSGAMLILTIVLLKPIFRRRLSKTWQYYIWLMVIIRLLVPFGPEINIFTDLFQEVEFNMPIAATVMPMAIATPKTEVDAGQGLPDAAELPRTQAKDNRASFSLYFTMLKSNLWVIWSIVAVGLFTHKIISYGHLVRQIKANSTKVKDAEILEIYGEICSSIHIRRRPVLYLNEHLPAAMLVGMFNPFIVLPEQKMNGTALQYVFQHELTHHKRHDLYYKWLLQLVACLHWYNPFVYLMKREVNRNCELSCDEAIIRQIDESQRYLYGETLLAAIKPEKQSVRIDISLSLNEDTRMLKERLEAIMKFKKKNPFVGYLAVFLTMILFVAATCTGVYAQTKIIAPKPAMENKSFAVEKNLRDGAVMQSASIDAFSYRGTWADGMGLISDTYTGQLEEKIDFITTLYEAHNEKFIIFETVPEEKITDMTGTEDLFAHSSVYRALITVTDSLLISGKDRTFMEMYDGEKEYQKTAFYIDNPATLQLKLDYALIKGKLGILLVSPTGEIVYQHEPSAQFTQKIDLPLEKGLWSIVLLKEYENGKIHGVKGIKGTITYTTEPQQGSGSNAAILPGQLLVDFPVIQAGQYEEYGPYQLKAGDLVSTDLNWSNAAGGVYVAIGNMFYSDYGKSLYKDMIVQEDGLFYIYIGNPSADEPDVKDVAGKITINRSK